MDRKFDESNNIVNRNEWIKCYNDVFKFCRCFFQFKFLIEEQFRFKILNIRRIFMKYCITQYSSIRLISSNIRMFMIYVNKGIIQSDFMFQINESYSRAIYYKIVQKNKKSVEQNKLLRFGGI